MKIPKKKYTYLQYVEAILLNEGGDRCDFCKYEPKNYEPNSLSNEAYSSFEEKHKHCIHRAYMYYGKDFIAKGGLWVEDQFKPLFHIEEEGDGNG